MTGASAQPFRLPRGGAIDRSQTVSFRFDGRTCSAHPGDTLASALLANGIRLVGRSFKYHRPRGILSAGVEEPNALVELRERALREPNTRATLVEVWDGLSAGSQNRWPSLWFDLGAVNQLFAPLISAGFYYKTFMWPASFWERIYEPFIRRAAGLGRAAQAADPDAYEKTSLHCDVLVIGGGPSGLAASLAAARTGARVVLCEQDFAFGGRLVSERVEVAGMPAADWAASAVAELAAAPNVTLLGRTTVIGCYDGGAYVAVERVADHLPAVPRPSPRQRLWKLRARSSVLATGALERPLVFANNDRPGIMLAGAVRSYINRFAVAPGRRAVVVGNNDSILRTSADMRAAGIEVAGCVDLRPGSHPMPKGDVIRAARIVRARGGRAVSGLDLELTDGARQSLDCDLVAMSGGWDPALHLSAHLGARPQWDEAQGMFLAVEGPPGMRIAGSAAGRTGTGACLADGHAAGLAAAETCGRTDSAGAAPAAGDEPYGYAPIRIHPLPGKAFVDFQNDVTGNDLVQAREEGFGPVELAKRYTTLGMATDQGKTSNVNAMLLLAGLDAAAGGTAKPPAMTTFRPPYTPVAIGALAGQRRGRDAHPTRYTPAHDWAQSQGAVFIEAGGWLRAQYFTRSDEDWFAAMQREVWAVRSGVGLCDVSTLGKIHVEGPDAATLLERVYTNRWRKLAVGRARYGLMLREDGFVFDDGTTSRLAEETFLMTTTTGNAGAVLEHLDYLTQCRWPDLDVRFAMVTEDWAQFSVAGPQSRRVLEQVVDAPFDLSDAAFPYMAAAELTVASGVRARLFRISFSGELAYEIAVPTGHGSALAYRLMEAGQPFGITPYGLEALGAMRLEKGHIGPAEMNGTATARDLGLGRMMALDKPLFWGREMSQRPALLEPERPILVGLRSADGRSAFRGGAHLFARGVAPSWDTDLGHVSSAGWSPMLEQWIGLGFCAGGEARLGETIVAHDPIRKASTELVVCDPVFFDPKGDRLRA